MEKRLPIVGFEGSYEISSLGKVYSLDKVRNFGNPVRQRLIKGRELKSFSGGHGYQYVTLCFNQSDTKALIHRIVAEHFIPNPEGKPEVNHIDGNKNNNAVENLEWVTRSENEKHAHKIGLKSQGSGRDSVGAKYTYFCINIDKNEIISIMVGDKELLSQGFTPTNVRRVCRGKGNSHKGYYFTRIHSNKEN